jgi:tRNA1(Val) A37 N6-methylase TrmN6
VVDEQTFSEDSLLGGRVTLRQPKDGYRVALDPVLLASAIGALKGESVLDLGAGVGAASLCLAARVKDIHITGIEVDRTYVRCAFDNVVKNNMRGLVEILHGDLLSPPPRLSPGSYSHVMANPPFFENGKGRASPISGRNQANIEGEANLESWVKFCLNMVKVKGTVTFIHLPERLDQLLSLFYGKLGNIKIFPFWSGGGKPAQRVVVQGTKGLQGGLTLCAGITLHTSTGAYTAEAEELLRHAQGIYWGDF